MPAYPLTFPTNVAPGSVKVKKVWSQARFDNPLQLSSQVQLRNASRWEIDVTLQAMPAAEAEDWTQFFDDLRGGFGTFTLDLDPHCPGLLTGGVAEIFTVDFAGQTAAGLANQYITAADASGAVYVWFNLDAGGVDPAPAGRGIAVAITTGQTAAQIATAFASAVDADASFSASPATALVTVTNEATGARTNADDGTTTTTVATTQAGVTAAAPGSRTFRMAANELGWDSQLAVEFGFSFTAIESI